MTDQETSNNLIKWRSFPGRLYAEMVAEALHKNKIECIIKGEDKGILGAGSVTLHSPGKISIWLLENDRDKAEEIAQLMINNI